MFSPGRGPPASGRNDSGADPVPERAHVLDQLQQLFLVHLSLIGRHDRLESGRDLLVRVHDRLADIRFVDGDGFAGLQRHGLAEQSVEHRAAALRVAAVAGVAGEIPEQLAARGRERSFGLAAAQPRLELAGLEDDDLADHPGMAVPQYSAQNR